MYVLVFTPNNLIRKVYSLHQIVFNIFFKKLLGLGRYGERERERIKVWTNLPGAIDIWFSAILKVGICPGKLEAVNPIEIVPAS